MSFLAVLAGLTEAGKQETAFLGLGPSESAHRPNSGNSRNPRLRRLWPFLAGWRRISDGIQGLSIQPGAVEATEKGRASPRLRSPASVCKPATSRLCLGADQSPPSHHPSTTQSRRMHKAARSMLLAPCWHRADLLRP